MPKLRNLDRSPVGETARDEAARDNTARDATTTGQTGYLFGKDAIHYESDYTLGNQNIQYLVLESEMNQRVDDLLDLLSNYRMMEQLVHQDLEPLLQDLHTYVQMLKDEEQEATSPQQASLSEAIAYRIRTHHLTSNVELLLTLQTVTTQAALDQQQQKIINLLLEIPQRLTNYVIQQSSRRVSQQVLDLQKVATDLITHSQANWRSPSKSNQPPRSKQSRANNSRFRQGNATVFNGTQPNSDRYAGSSISELIKQPFPDLIVHFSQAMDQFIRLLSGESLTAETLQEISEKILQMLEVLCQKLVQEQRHTEHWQTDGETYDDHAIAAILEQASDHLNLLGIILNGTIINPADPKRPESERVDDMVNALQSSLLTRISDLLYLCEADTAHSLPIQQLQAIGAIKPRLYGLRSLLTRLIANQNRDRTKDNLFLLIPAHCYQEPSTQQTVVKTKGNLILKDRLTPEDVSKDQDSADLLFVPLWSSKEEAVTTLMSLSHNPAIQQEIRIAPLFDLLPPESPDYFGESVPDQNLLQSGQNSCTAHAAIALMNYFYGKVSQEPIQFSSRFLYRMTRQLARRNGKLADTGASLRDTMKAMQLFGVPPEEYWLWEETSPEEEPPPFCYAYAQKFQATHYFRLDRPEIKDVRAEMKPETLLAQIKVVLAAKFPIMFGIKITAETLGNVDSEGKIPYETFNNQSDVGHAMVAVGYDDSKNAIKVRNSWGAEWGDRGYGWLPYEYILQKQTTSWWSMIRADWVDTGKFGMEANFGARNSENQGNPKPSNPKPR
ncbi:MAG: C1 family peptidase [Synechococcales bacterium]|nr:C1 family peptidase [Synechococcales bacterium]